MSLPMGRGSRQVRSGGLVRKRDGEGRAVKGKGTKETEISVSFIDVLVRHDSTRELQTHTESARV
jgi:hypothetical protein